MAFKESILQDLDTFLSIEDFGQEVIYTGSDGSKRIRAIFLSKSDLAIEDMNGVETAIPALLAKRSDLLDLQNGDTFTIDGQNYTVIQTEYKDQHIVKVYLSKDRRPLF